MKLREETLYELLKEESFEATYQEAIERKRKLKDLQEHPGFKVFIEQLEKQVERRFSEMVDFPSGLDSCIKTNYALGEIAGIKLALGWAGLLIDAAQGVIDLQNHIDRVNEQGED